MTQSDRSALAALIILILLHLFMLATLLAGVPPHPPAQIPLFGMAPFFAAVLSAAVAAALIGPLETRAGRGLTILAILLSLVSFGPHKAVDPAFPLIWPAVVTAWCAIGCLALSLYKAARRVGGA